MWDSLSELTSPLLFNDDCTGVDCVIGWGGCLGGVPLSRSWDPGSAQVEIKDDPIDILEHEVSVLKAETNIEKYIKNDHEFDISSYISDNN